jgi:hypothetical protein
MVVMATVIAALAALAALAAVPLFFAVHVSSVFVDVLLQLQDLVRAGVRAGAE